MVYSDGTCWMGQNESIYAIEKEISKSTGTLAPTPNSEVNSPIVPTNTTTQEKQVENVEESTPNDGKKILKLCWVQYYLFWLH